MIPTEIQLTLRLVKGTPLTAQEMDDNLTKIRTAVLGIADVVKAGRIIFGTEPAPGEREGVLWIKTTGEPFMWNVSLSRWEPVREQAAWDDASIGTATAYEVTLPVNTPDLPSITGRLFTFIPHLTNTGAATLKINALSPIPLVNESGGALTAGQVVIGRLAVVISDGTSARVLNTATVAIPQIREIVTALFDPVAAGVAGVVIPITATPALTVLPTAQVYAVSQTTDSGWPVNAQITVESFAAELADGDDDANLFTVGVIPANGGNPVSLTVSTHASANGINYVGANGVLRNINFTQFLSYFKLKAFLRYIPA